MNGGDITSTNTANAVNLFDTTTGNITFGKGHIDMSASGSKTTVRGNLKVGENTEITGDLLITPFNTKGVVHNDSSGKLSSSLIVNDDLTINTINYDKIQKISLANRVLGSTSNGGNVSEVQINSAMILSSAVTTPKIEVGAVSYAKMQQISLGNRVLGSINGGIVSEVQVNSDMIASGTNITGSAATVTSAAQPAITSLGTLTGLTINGTLTVGGSSLNFASYTSAGTTIINGGNHIVSGTGITLELNTSTPITGTFCIIYNTSNNYTLSQNGTSSNISANNTTVCIYNGSIWVAYSNGVLNVFT
jgi:hypothetical protein